MHSWRSNVRPVGNRQAEKSIANVLPVTPPTDSGTECICARSRAPTAVHAQLSSHPSLLILRFTRGNDTLKDWRA